MNDTDLPTTPENAPQDAAGVEGAQGAGAPTEPGSAPDPAQAQGSGASAATPLPVSDPDELRALADDIQRGPREIARVFIAPEDGEVSAGDGVKQIRQGDYVFSFADGGVEIVPAARFMDFVGRH